MEETSKFKYIKYEIKNSRVISLLANYLTDKQEVRCTAVFFIFNYSNASFWQRFPCG